MVDSAHPVVLLCYLIVAVCVVIVAGALAIERYERRQDERTFAVRVLLQHRPLGAPEPLGGDRPTAGKVTPKNAPKETL